MRQPPTRQHPTDGVARNSTQPFGVVTTLEGSESMEARTHKLRTRCKNSGSFVASGLAILFLAMMPAAASAASPRSQNFIVSAQTKALAVEICEAAETYRRDLAIEWLGAELPPWQQPCPIEAQVHPGLGAGGATQFSFSR